MWALIKVNEAEEELERMLADVLSDLTSPTVESVWNVFKEFCRMPVECASDMFLFQCGVFTSWEGEFFHFEFLRQFCINAPNEEGEDDYDHMEQLRCTFLFEPTPALRSVKFNRWADEDAPVDEFFPVVEGFAIFQALRDKRAWKFQVSQDWV